MEITLKRAYDSGKSTIGIISLSGKSFVTLEDTHRKVKIDGETCISKGRYEVKFREVESGLTMKYRKKYPWFKWHLWLQCVLDFEFVYLHIGNFAKNTDGCVLIAESYNSSNPDMILNSEKAFRKFYKLVSNELYKGERVYLNIK